MHRLPFSLRSVLDVPSRMLDALHWRTNLAAYAFFFPINVHFLSEYARRISNPILFFCGVCWIHLRVCWMQYIVDSTLRRMPFLLPKFAANAFLFASFFLLSVAAYAFLFTEYSA